MTVPKLEHDALVAKCFRRRQAILISCRTPRSVDAYRADANASDLMLRRMHIECANGSLRPATTHTCGKNFAKTDRDSRFESARDLASRGLVWGARRPAAPSRAVPMRARELREPGAGSRATASTRAAAYDYEAIINCADNAETITASRGLGAEKAPAGRPWRACSTQRQVKAVTDGDSASQDGSARGRARPVACVSSAEDAS